MLPKSKRESLWKVQTDLLQLNASEILQGKGTMVVPDILANGGGVVVSYFEWVQDLVWLFWEEKDVRDKLRVVMHKSFDKVL